MIEIHNSQPQEHLSMPSLILCSIKIIRFKIAAKMSIKYRRQPTEGYAHDGKLIGRGARDQELDGNRDTIHKIYTGSGHQDDVKPYVLCSVGLY